MDENEAGVYVGDHAVTLDVSVNSYDAFTLNPVTNTILGADPDEKPLLHQRISFVVNKHMSHLSLVVHRKNPIDEDEDNYYVQVQLNAHSLGHMELTELSEEEWKRSLPKQKAGKGLSSQSDGHKSG